MVKVCLKEKTIEEKGHCKTWYITKPFPVSKIQDTIKGLRGS